LNNCYLGLSASLSSVTAVAVFKTKLLIQFNTIFWKSR